MAAVSGKGPELIKRLLEAEKQAEGIIANAKKERLATLKSAKTKAEEDVKAFTADVDAKHEREMGSKARADPAAELKHATTQGISMVNQDYTANKDKTVKYITSKVLDVPLELTETQKQALMSGMA